ncbi:MAG: phosphonate ABC transporter, permease protein PhnE, partial [Streptococcus sp.]|nr:phosphonate ABC transporter, permease protein PhnE [Streptococcus sp.]
MKLKELFTPKECTLENGTTVKEPRSKVIFITILLLIAMYFAGK